MPAISIVMPVHNTGKYLRECLNSILNQTYKDWELICVDDNSTDDETISILNEYRSSAKECNDKIRFLFCKEAMGAARARNIGFQEVKGIYTIFLDSDDIFAPDMLENMYDKIVEDKADVCLCGFKTFYIESGSTMPIIDQHYPCSKAECQVEEKWLYIAGCSPWRKLCRTSFLQRNRIDFQSLASCNDVYYSCMVMLLAEKITAIPDSEYVNVRVRNPMQISSNRNSMHLYTAIKYTLDSLSQRRVLDEDRLKKLLALLMLNGLYEIRECRNDQVNQEFYQKVSVLLKKYSVIFSNLRLRAMAEKWITNSMDGNWIALINDYESQLDENTKHIYDLCKSYRNIYLWGMGKRGKAFEKWAKDNEIIIQGVCDKKNDQIGELTDYGNLIRDKDDILLESGLLIATNEIIYKDLLLYINNERMTLFNLEEMCPL